MSNWGLRTDHLDAGLRDDESSRAPGKRSLTQGLQRQVASVAAGTAAPSAPAGFDLAIGQSFLDSVLAAPVQRHGGDGEQDAGEVHALAAAGTAGAGSPLPFLDRIQAAFGRHDVTGVQAHTDGAAAAAAGGMGATAFAAGNHVAFGGAPDLHTTAHEAAHVIQQRAGVHLKGGVGEEGDPHERHADAVADAVVAGDSAEGLLDEYAGPGGAGEEEGAPAVEGRIDVASVQRKEDKKKAKKPVRVKPDGSKPGEVVQLLYQADDALSLLIEKTTALRNLQPSTPDETIKATADGLVPTKAIIVGAFKQCHKILFDYIGNQNAFKMFEELRKQPGMDIAATMAAKLGQVLYNNDLVAKEHPGASSPFFTSSIVGEYNHVILNLGYEHVGYEQLKQLAPDKVVVVNPHIVDLGTGTPRDRMQEIVLTMTRAWDRSVTNFSNGLQSMVSTIEAAQFKEADPGLLGKVWETAKGLLEKGATLISGTPLGAKAAFFLFDKLWEYEKKAEQDREQASQDTFIRHLVQLRDSLQLGAGGDKDAKQGGTRITKMVDVMEAEFAKLGKGDDGAFKRGDNFVGGAQAEFLRDMTAKADAYSDSIPTTSAFTAGFLQDWVTSNHTRKKSGAFRSPTAGSTHWDGYIAVDVVLRHSSYSGWLIDKQDDTPKLHCPKSAEVAKSLVNSLDPFDLSKVTCPIHATIVYKDAPKGFDDDSDLVVMTGGGYVANDRQRSKWQGVTSTAAKHGEGNVLAKFKTLEG